ncbi:integration host factor, actinobacterial type [Rhodococcus sp. HNM0569]|uniref:integration host factor, actinobacterial type n=1 Tax=Rhodococcus sp. HNM0569 TaxID=2716340 RepID=UPI00146D8C32|nr:integration host factor, actinobacterial type [Rhodococcus sp. HNM0569]NLU82147.1 integration host factor [Rhodococcus sp. HNM0569]
MALPSLTPEQRKAALEKAALARTARAKLREDLKSGKTNLAEVFTLADEDETIAKTKVLYVLESLPKVGKTTAASIVEEVGIPATRRLGGLGSQQRDKLLAKFSD